MSNQGMYSQSNDQVFSKGGGGPFSSSDSTGFHGADIRLEKDALGSILHIGRHAVDFKPTVRSYSDGIRVGCTFVTNEAIELIYSWHQEFLKNGNSKVHQ